MEIVVAQDRDHGSASHVLELLGEDAGLFGQTVVGEIARQKEDVLRRRGLRLRRELVPLLCFEVVHGSAPRVGPDDCRPPILRNVTELSESPTQSRNVPLQRGSFLANRSSGASSRPAAPRSKGPC